MVKEETVCAVVVTYNRKNLLLECLDALRKQTRPIQAMYIIDNFSTDGTPDALKEHFYISDLPPSNLTEPWEKEFEIQNLTDGQLIRVHYVRMNENTGGAGGFHEGVKRGYEKGYDWLWLMDDDGLAQRNCLEVLLSKKEMGDFLAPLVIRIDKKDEMSFGLGENLKTIEDCKKHANDGVLVNVANPFNGILISNKLVRSIGFPKKEMFIWGDEVEYQLRAIKAKLIPITVVYAIYYHPKARLTDRMIFFKNFSINITNNKAKNFCLFRNQAYISLRYHKLSLFIQMLKYSWYFIITERLNFKGFLFYAKATIHGLLGIWGGGEKVPWKIELTFCNNCCFLFIQPSWGRAV